MRTTSPTPLQFLPFELRKLEEYLQLEPPVLFDQRRALRQLRYVEEYARDLRCQSVVIENRYVDRDYMEDHSVFYSKCFHPYSNFCKRVHFFSKSASEVEATLKRILGLGARQGIRVYRSESRKFSRDAYLGFSVIKPLHGSPVGRTVLRSFGTVPDDPKDQSRRLFGCIRRYDAHLLGVELSVRGLAFQQQDVGVSACATTAIWSALQKMRDHEDISAFTPAQITALASKHSLPFGRAMPSEGLSIDQMCQAIQAVGLSPCVFRADHIDNARGYLHSAVMSGLAPVLILRQDSNFHAISVAGIKVRTPHQASIKVKDTDDLAGDLIALYVHDDRRGPYLKANLMEKDGRPMLHIPSREGGDGEETWDLKHILIPTHPKIRLSISGLRECALRVAARVHCFREYLEQELQLGPFTEKTVTFETRIVKSHRYSESVIKTSKNRNLQPVAELCMMPLPRYVGIVRVGARRLGRIDLLVDTTSTTRNAHCLGVLVFDEVDALASRFAKDLAEHFRCPYVGHA